LRTVVIVGAGASAGYDPEHPEACPPTTRGLFESREFTELLQLSRYAPLRRAWESWRVAHSSGEVEAFADTLAARLETLYRGEQGRLPRDPTWWEQTGELAGALGGLWYLLFEGFQKFQREHRGGHDNYRALLNRFEGDDLSIVSLNYDALLEASILAKGLRYSYAPSREHGTIWILKPHGSLTWLNPASEGGGQVWYTDQDKQVKAVFQMVYSNIFGNAPTRVITPTQFTAIEFTDLILAAKHYFIPGILPPIGIHKDPRQVPILERAWDDARRLLAGADRVVFIGTSLREQDVGLRDAITLGLVRRTNIELVGDYPRLKSILDRSLGWTRYHDLPNARRFTEWVSRLSGGESKPFS
jgi:hypothetical protein